MRDITHDLLPVFSIVPIVANNTSEGTGVSIDLTKYEAAELDVLVGVSGDTLSGSVYWTISIQESADGSTGWADVAAADVIGGVPSYVIDAAAEDEVILRFGYKGSKRYIRAYAAATGTHTNGTPLAAVVIKGFPMHAPTF